MSHPSTLAIASPVLVTGGSGYLASRLIPRLHEGGATIRVLSRRSPGIDAPFQFIQGHAGDAASLTEALAGARTIFHLAGQTSVAVAKQHPALDRIANVDAMKRLIDAIEPGTAPVVVFAGTVTQSGIPPADTVTERDPDRPITVYDSHKLEAERLLESASAAGIARGVTLRWANVYGPGAAATAADRGVLNQMIRLASAGRTLTIFGDGLQLRDYTYVDDVAAAFVKAALAAADISGRHFVLGSGQRRTFAQIVEAVASRAGVRLGRHVAVQRVAPPAALDPIDARSYVVDASAFTAATGWRPETDLDTGIDRTLEWVGAQA